MTEPQTFGSSVSEHTARQRLASRMARRDAVLVAAQSAAFVGAAAAASLALPAGRDFDAGVAAALVIAFGATFLARFPIGTGYTVPLQLVFVPMLFAVPARDVPLLVLAGWLVGSLPALVRGEMHPTRLLLVPANCWFSLGPAIVIAAAGDPAPSWGDWPLYAGALAAQFGGDLLVSMLDDWLRQGTRPSLHVRAYALVSSIDLLLSPAGLLAAMVAAGGEPYSFLALLPIAGVLALFATERQRRFEAERATVRQRESLIAGASHEMRTPLGVLAGLVGVLRSGAQLPDAKRTEAYSVMDRQVGRLAHLVRQFLDYTSLKAGRPLELLIEDVDVRAAADQVARLHEPAAVRVRAPDALPLARADAERVTQVLANVVGNALKHGPPDGPVEIELSAAGGRVVVAVRDHGPGIAASEQEAVFGELHGGEEGTGAGAGLGLYLTREILRLQGGSIRLADPPGGGLLVVVELPAAEQPGGLHIQP